LTGDVLKHKLTGCFKAYVDRLF